MQPVTVCIYSYIVEVSVLVASVLLFEASAVVALAIYLGHPLFVASGVIFRGIGCCYSR